MIHHLARAFFVRNVDRTAKPPSEEQAPSSPAARPLRPVKARPITPWQVPAGAQAPVRSPAKAGDNAVRISVDPSDRRRTVIAGRFAEVCAALDRLVMEQEAAA